MSCLITFCYKQNIISRKNNAKVIIFIERGCYPLLIFYLLHHLSLKIYFATNMRTAHCRLFLENLYLPLKIKAKQQLLL